MSHTDTLQVKLRADLQSASSKTGPIHGFSATNSGMLREISNESADKLPHICPSEPIMDVLSQGVNSTDMDSQQMQSSSSCPDLSDHADTHLYACLPASMDNSAIEPSTPLSAAPLHDANMATGNPVKMLPAAHHPEAPLSPSSPAAALGHNRGSDLSDELDGGPRALNDNDPPVLCDLCFERAPDIGVEGCEHCMCSHCAGIMLNRVLDKPLACP